MKTIIANWKMNVGVRESVALARGTLLTLRGQKVIPELVICPAFVALSEVRKVVARSSVHIGAQNVCWAATGAFTGEISARMLAELEVSHVLVGHSERRLAGQETEEMIHQKMLLVFEQQLMPVLCVGETLQQHEVGNTKEILKKQLVSALNNVRLRVSDRLAVAYEPVWAIGTGEVCPASEVIHIHAFIRSVMAEILQTERHIPVYYGGSVDGENSYEFLRESEIDGVLVGSASVKLNQFKDIVRAAVEVLEAQKEL